MNFSNDSKFSITNHDSYCKFSWWISLWQNILTNWDISYFQISELNFHFRKNKSAPISFSTNQFFNSGKYAWPYSFNNAELVIEHAKFHKNVQELLFNHPFYENLLLHKTLQSLIEINPFYNDEDEEEFELHFQMSNSVFANSGKSQQEYFDSLKISGWTYTQVIISAICYCIEHIYIENAKLPETIFWKRAKFPEKMQKKSLLFDLEMFFYSIFDYLMCFETSEALVEVFKETNIISTYPLQLIKAFNRTFKKIDKEIDDDKWLSYDMRIKKNNIHELSLFHIFKAFNLDIIFSDQLISTVIKWNIYRKHFHGIRNMFSICESFLNKLDLFQSHFLQDEENNDFNYFDYDSNSFVKKEHHTSSIEKIEEMFIIAFFQLQTIHDIGFEYQFGCLENKYFIDLVELFHTMFPSFSVEKIYSITENQYLRLKNEAERLGKLDTIKQKWKKLKYLGSFLTIASSILVFPQIAQAISFRPTRPRLIALPEAHVVSVQSTRNPRNSQNQVLQVKAQKKQLQLTTGTNSRRAQVAQNHSQTWLVEVHDRTGGEHFMSKGKKYIIVNGMGGNYNEIKKQMNELNNYAKKIGAEIVEINELVKAHIAPTKMRQNCNVSKNNGSVILASKLWNTTEESGGQLGSRDLRYHADFIGVPFEQIMHQRHEMARKEIIEKLTSLSNLPDDKLFRMEMTIAGHEEMSYVSTRQLDADRSSLNVRPEEGIFVFYARGTMTTMKDLYNHDMSPLQMTMFNAPGDGKKHVFPGIVINKSLKELDIQYLIGLGICENISEPTAKQILRDELTAVYHKGYNTAMQASKRFSDLKTQQNQFDGVTGLPTFYPSGSTFGPEPGTPEFQQNLNHKRQQGLKNTPLANDEALVKSRDHDIDNCNTRVRKHKTRDRNNFDSWQVFTNNFRQHRPQSARAKILKSYPIAISDNDI